MIPEVEAPSRSPSRSHSFVTNVLWNWSTIAVNIFTAFFLSAYIVRRLGPDNYGLWALTVSLAEYYWIMDLGFRSATVKYTAHYAATGEKDRINDILSTALFYSSCVGPLILIANYFLLPLIARRIHAEHPMVVPLVTIVVSAWVLGSLFNVFSAALEGFRRFDLISRIYLVASVVRSFGTAALLWKGYGVLQMALMTLAAQIVVHVLSFFAIRRVFPEMHFGRKHVKFPTMKMMLSYGSHSVVASLAQRTLSQGAPLAIGALLPLKFVGYYTSPTRILDYLIEGILRIGEVSNPNASETLARKDHDGLVRLAVITNRYSLALFLPLSVFLFVYGRPLIAAWINPPFAAQSAGVLFALLFGFTLAQAGQYNSSSILFGMGRHKMYSRALLVEAALVIGCIFLVVPRYGVTGAAWTVSSLMVLNRGCFTAWLISRELHIGYLWFLGQVYQPILVAIPAAVILFVLRQTILPGANWPQLILAGMIAVACYAPLVLLIMRAGDRERLFAAARRTLFLRFAKQT